MELSDTDHLLEPPIGPSRDLFLDADAFNQAQYDDLLSSSRADLSIADNAGDDDDEVIERPQDLVSSAYAAEESYYIRPNRYYGPPATWRSWTKDDRAVAGSLDHLRQRDLGIHLYNAYALKDRFRARRLLESQDTKGKGVKGGVSPAPFIPRGDAPVFEPPRTWTAWPLSPADVPREELLPVGTLGNDAIRFPKKDTRPSAFLEDCLISATTKQSRERWNARVRLEQISGVTGQGEKSPIIGDDNFSGAENAQKIKEVLSHRPIFSSQLADTEDESEDAPTDEPTRSWNGKAELGKRLVPMADESKVRKILLPSARCILSQLDRLLDGMHRVAHGHTRSSERGTREDIVLSERGDADASSARHRGRSLRRARSRTSASSQRSGLSKMPQSVSAAIRRHEPGLQDWSFILGVAALVGWNQAVVDRAAARCARLFGQDMLFRTFHECDGENDGPYTEHLASGKNPERASWRRADEVTHGAARDQPPSETSDQQSIPALVCPFRDCTRHAVVFPTRQKLRRHLRAVHGRSQSAGTETDLSSAQGIRCPVLACSRHDTGFSKGSSLYRHIRAQHPEVDVESFKKLDIKRRGDSRGRCSKDDARRQRRFEAGRDPSTDN